jgi:hypothetical protein
MEIGVVIIMLFLFFVSRKLLKNSELLFSPFRPINLKEITGLKESYSCEGGSCEIKNEAVISNFHIQSKFSLIVIKLKNVSKEYQLNYYSNTDIDTSVQSVCYRDSLFDDDYTVNSISLISDKEIKCHINTDSIKSFSMDLNKYVIKINNNINRIMIGELEYYALKHISSNVLFHKIEDEVYIFILTPLKKKIVIEEDTLYNFLFPALD